MIDLSTALPLAASEITLTVGALVLLVAGAFIGDRSARGVSIAAVALPRLFARYPDLALADPAAEPSWRKLPFFRGLETLRVRTGA